MADTAAANEPMDSVAGPLKRGEADSPVLPGSPKKQRVGDDQPTTPKDDRMDPSGERASKTPRLEDSPDQQRMLQVTSTDLGLYEHEDAPVKFDFNNDDVDRMEKYELFYDDVSSMKMIQEWKMATWPRSWSNLHFLILKKNQSSVPTSFCDWMHWQTSLNFKAGTSAGSARCCATYCKSVEQKSTTQRAKQVG